MRLTHIICEAAGTEYPLTLTNINNLALVLREQGKYERAEGMHQQGLELCETILGKEHRSTLASVSNLGNVMSDKDKYQEAEEMPRQALRLMETVLAKTILTH